MGCVVSTEGDDDRRRIIGVSAAAGSNHIVSLTSSTYGILTAPRAYDIGSSCNTPPPPPPPPPPPQQPPSPPEVINSWELMAGLLDTSSTPAKTHRRPATDVDGAVLYTTSLRAVRATFEACNAVRAALQAHGVAYRERDVSMDRGFRDELLRLLPPKTPLQLPRLFVRGRRVDEVLRLEEEGRLAPLLEGLPKPCSRGGGTCDGCGGISFLPCFDCSGSRKLAVPLLLPNNNDESRSKCNKEYYKRSRRSSSSLVVRCRECNENGLVLCPICS